ncbi:hypothetical protein CGZ69_35645 [Streptomyces peucetius subsp. caesius ATCC 27952]|nr:hypothetical protein CGZ69_35645 [Streptomyces peucetius subsp. caesius ATCC 27952]
MFKDASFVEDDDVVGFAGGAEAVSDEYDGSALAEGADAFVHGLFGAGVERLVGSSQMRMPAPMVAASRGPWPRVMLWPAEVGTSRRARFGAVSTPRRLHRAGTAYRTASIEPGQADGDAPLRVRQAEPDLGQAEAVLVGLQPHGQPSVIRRQSLATVHGPSALAHPGQWTVSAIHTSGAGLP